MQGSTHHRLRQCWSVLLCATLLMPSTIQFVHDHLHNHEHTKCAGELDGTIHYHDVEVDCDYNPVFIGSFTYQNAGELALPIDVISSESVENYKTPHCLNQRNNLRLRGPPSGFSTPV